MIITMPIPWHATMAGKEWTAWLDHLAVALRAFAVKELQPAWEAHGMTCQTLVDLDGIPDALRYAEVEQDGDCVVRLRVTVPVTQQWASNDGSGGGWERDAVELVIEPADHGRAIRIVHQEEGT